MTGEKRKLNTTEVKKYKGAIESEKYGEEDSGSGSQVSFRWNYDTIYWLDLQNFN